MTERPAADFVRGKYQISRFKPGSPATGRRLTEREVVEAYGTEVIAEVDAQRSAVLLAHVGAIERAIATRRTELGINREELARAASVPPDTVVLAETNADQLGLRDIERIAFVLGLDPARLSVDERAGADPELGVRLRVLEVDAGRDHRHPAYAPVGVALRRGCVRRYCSTSTPDMARQVRSGIGLQAVRQLRAAGMGSWLRPCHTYAYSPWDRSTAHRVDARLGREATRYSGHSGGIAARDCGSHDIVAWPTGHRPQYCRTKYQRLDPAHYARS